MGRRKKEMAQMGRAIIKDFRGKRPARGGESFRHTAELNDGNERGILGLQSVTEQTSLGDFLATAEMAGRSFKAEKENVQIVTPEMNSGLPSKEKLEKIRAAQDLYKSLLRIPRRPPWKKSTTADQLKLDEQSSFVEWRRLLSRLQEDDHIMITPYEKNLEFWRQLWRVIERSDVVVQIVDARNPLLFWCPDLDKYVQEVDPQKQTLLLVNKADLLSANQRQAWAEYFAKLGVNVVFWSAVEESARIQSEKVAESENVPAENDSELAAVTERLKADDDAHSSSSEDGDADTDRTASVMDEVNPTAKDCDPHSRIRDSGGDDGGDDRKDDNDDVEKCDKGEAEDGTALEEEGADSDGFETEEEYTDDGEDTGNDSDCVEEAGDSVKNKDHVTPTDDSHIGGVNAVTLQAVSGNLRTSEELLELFRRTARTHCTPGVTTVGMVGYPNVGKSSTINTILQTKKVPVSATPGRTKHFQTLFVEKDLMLCDCPGLVFPSFVNSKAELVVNGILPIDQLQDCEPPVALVCERAGRAAFEGTYHINLPPPEKWEDPDKPPSAYDLLHAYGLLRGFMSHKGNPDRPRAARYILKDYVNGKLLFCHPPPGIDPKAFQKPPYAEPKVYKIPRKPCAQKTELEIKTEALDREFFAQMKVRAHAKGPHAVSDYVRTEGLRQVGLGQGQASGASTPQGSQTSVAGKPWKRHNNRNKKEKLRRLYTEHDRH